VIHHARFCRRGRLVPAVLLAVLLSAAPAPAQYFGARAGAALPGYRGGLPVVNPLGYGAYGPGGFGYYQTPLNGALTGSADLTVANSIYYKNTEQARVTREQSRQAMIDTRRKMIEEQLYEQSLQPTGEDLRDRARAEVLRRARTEPERTEIWSGQALNTLLKAIQSGKSQGLEGPTVPIDSSLLPRINLTDGTTSTGSGVLKDLTRFTWPLTLRRKDYADGRTSIEKLARKAADQAPSGTIDAETIEGLRDAVKNMETQVNDAVLSMSPSVRQEGDSREARQLRELKGSFKVLEDPNVASYFNGKRSAKGATVGELISNLTTEGLSFAPAASGEESAYNAVYQLMRTYDSGMARLAMSNGSNGPGYIAAPRR
jgi:hypothetical protein